MLVLLVYGIYCGGLLVDVPLSYTYNTTDVSIVDRGDTVKSWTGIKELSFFDFSYCSGKGERCEISIRLDKNTFSLNISEIEGGEHGIGKDISCGNASVHVKYIGEIGDDWCVDGKGSSFDNEGSFCLLEKESFRKARGVFIDGNSSYKDAINSPSVREAAVIPEGNGTILARREYVEVERGCDSRGAILGGVYSLVDVVFADYMEQGTIGIHCDTCEVMKVRDGDGNTLDFEEEGEGVNIKGLLTFSLVAKGRGEIVFTPGGLKKGEGKGLAFSRSSIIYASIFGGIVVIGATIAAVMIIRRWKNEYKGDKNTRNAEEV